MLHLGRSKDKKDRKASPTGKAGSLERRMREAERAGDRQELERVAARLHEYGCLEGAEPSEREMVEGLYRYVGKVPSKLVVASLVDAVGDVRPQNMPGTGADQYPNWCVPLCDSDGEEVFIEDLPSNERLTSLFALLTGSVR